jgi:hypothetical protein
LKKISEIHKWHGVDENEKTTYWFRYEPRFDELTFDGTLLPRCFGGVRAHTGVDPDVPHGVDPDGPHGPQLAREYTRIPRRPARATTCKQRQPKEKLIVEGFIRATAGAAPYTKLQHDGWTFSCSLAMIADFAQTHTGTVS